MSSGEESEEKIKCAKCKCIINDSIDFRVCYNCDGIICIKCKKKGHYINTYYSSRSNFIGTCRFCLKNGTNNYLLMYIHEWKTLYNKYKTLKDSKKSQTQYITELEAEIKLLKAMIDFQPNGEGYLTASEHFKQLVDKNDKNDDND
jgi:hypothetical protein